MSKNKLMLDGFILPADKGILQSLSPGYLKGKGVFETMRVYQGVIFALDNHIQRLFAGLKTLHIGIPYTKGQLREFCYNSLRSNKMDDARMRLTVWQEKHKERISIVTLPLEHIPERKHETGFKALISDIRRDERLRVTALKSIQYGPFLSALIEARALGFDEALLLNRKGYLVEGSRSNIFFIGNETVFTPALSSGCLNGITRQFVIRLAKEMGLEVKPVLAKPGVFRQADEAFLTNSLMELMPLTEVEGVPIGHGRAGSLTMRLLKKYRTLVKKSTK